MAVSTKRAVNKQAIKHLQLIRKDRPGTTLAKDARALERLLTSGKSDTRHSQATMERHLRSLAQAAVLYEPRITGLGPPSQAWTEVIPKRKVAAAKKRKVAAAKTANKKAAKAARPKKSRYSTKVFKCLEDFRTCCNDGDKKVCVAYAVICIAQQLQGLGIGVAAVPAIKFFLGH